MTEYTTQRKLDALQRELLLRQQKYPGYIQRGRMTALQAAYQIDVMRAIVADYEKLAQQERLI